MPCPKLYGHSTFPINGKHTGSQYATDLHATHLDAAAMPTYFAFFFVNPTLRLSANHIRFGPHNHV
jgi:hypothetical protein